MLLDNAEPAVPFEAIGEFRERAAVGRPSTRAVIAPVRIKIEDAEQAAARHQRLPNGLHVLVAAFDIDRTEAGVLPHPRESAAKVVGQVEEIALAERLAGDRGVVSGQGHRRGCDVQPDDPRGRLGGGDGPHVVTAAAAGHEHLAGHLPGVDREPLPERGMGRALVPGGVVSAIAFFPIGHHRSQFAGRAKPDVHGRARAVR